MKAWRLHDKGKLTLDELPSQSVGEGCVKIKTLACGISLTDVLMYEGKLAPGSLPVIIGRQCVGMVTETGENVTGLVRGDRVACGNCLRLRFTVACGARICGGCA